MKCDECAGAMRKRGIVKAGRNAWRVYACAVCGRRRLGGVAGDR